MAELKVLHAEPQGKGIVDTLKEALREAEAGELSSVAVACVYRDGSTGKSWSAAPSLSLLIGSVTRLQAALVGWADE